MARKWKTIGSMHSKMNGFVVSSFRKEYETDKPPYYFLEMAMHVFLNRPESHLINKRHVLDAVIVSIMAKPYILQKILNQ